MQDNSGIYSIINKMTGEIYIGSSINLKRRKREHFGKLKSNSHPNQKLQNLFNKYGLDVFEFAILQYQENNLIELEKEWVSKLDSIKSGYNLREPGSSLTGKTPSEEVKKKISDSLKEYYKNNPHPCLGQKLSQERIDKLGKKKIKKVWVYKDDVLVDNFDSAKLAAEALGLKKNRIQEVCIGKVYGKQKQRRSYAGYIFSYEEKKF